MHFQRHSLEVSLWKFHKTYKKQCCAILMKWTTHSHFSNESDLGRSVYDQIVIILWTWGIYTEAFFLLRKPENLRTLSNNFCSQKLLLTKWTFTKQISPWSVGFYTSFTWGHIQSGSMITVTAEAKYDFHVCGPKNMSEKFNLMLANQKPVLHHFNVKEMPNPDKLFT